MKQKHFFYRNRACSRFLRSPLHILPRPSGDIGQAFCHLWAGCYHDHLILPNDYMIQTTQCYIFTIRRSPILSTSWAAIGTIVIGPIAIVAVISDCNWIIVRIPLSCTFVYTHASSSHNNRNRRRKWFAFHPFGWICSVGRCGSGRCTQLIGTGNWFAAGTRRGIRSVTGRWFPNGIPRQAASSDTAGRQCRVVGRRRTNAKCRNCLDSLGLALNSYISSNEVAHLEL